MCVCVKNTLNALYMYLTKKTALSISLLCVNPSIVQLMLVQNLVQSSMYMVGGVYSLENTSYVQQE